MNVGVNGKARRGKDSVAAHGLNTGKASGFHEPKPLFNAARSATVAIMIDQPFAPDEAKALVVRSSEKNCVFPRNMALIVVAVQGPSLQLAAAQRTFMHQFVEWMLVVVPLFADRVKTGDEVCFRQGWLLILMSHRVTSMPS